mmetsp:Transcript_107481/g.303882  ORF Transcript_107481/g.303882 Transcript_107481/m.303882 type:complete len:245 (+) Transcript_107481:37-771(+)
MTRKGIRPVPAGLPPPWPTPRHTARYMPPSGPPRLLLPPREVALWDACSFLSVVPGAAGRGAAPTRSQFCCFLAPSPTEVFGPRGPRALWRSGRNWRSSSMRRWFLSSFSCKDALPSLSALYCRPSLDSLSLMSSSSAISCANFSGETLCAASRFAFSAASLMCLASITACSSSELMSLIAALSLAISASLFASLRRRASWRSWKSCWSFASRSWVSPSLLCDCAKSAWSCSLAAASCRSRSAA